MEKQKEWGKCESSRGKRLEWGLLRRKYVNKTIFSSQYTEILKLRHFDSNSSVLCPPP